VLAQVITQPSVSLSEQLNRYTRSAAQMKRLLDEGKGQAKRKQFRGTFSRGHFEFRQFRRKLLDCQLC
jgi:hypothetical protein